MILFFLIVVMGVFVVNLKIPLLTMIFYLSASSVLLLYNKYKKNENLNFILLFLGLFGIIMYGSLFNTEALITTIAERKADLAHTSIYANTSYHANMIYETRPNHFSVSVVINAGGFFIGTIPVSFDLNVWLIVAAYIFLAISTVMLVASIILIYKDNKIKTNDGEFKSFLKFEKKKNFITQLFSIIFINFILVLIMINEEVSIFNVNNILSDGSIDSTYISSSSIKNIMFGTTIIGRNVKILFNTNIFILLTYIFYIISLILLFVGKYLKGNQKKNYKSYMISFISSLGCFIVGSVLLLFTDSFLEYSISNSIIEGIKNAEIAISRDTNIFYLYNIFSSIVIILFYLYLIYYLFREDKEEKISYKKKLEEKKLQYFN